MKSLHISQAIQCKDVNTDLAVSSLNSQYELSINSGSAHIPLVHCLSSYGGKARYLTFPEAMARRYDGIAIGWQSNFSQGDVHWNITDLVIGVDDKIFPNDLPIMGRAVRWWRNT
jgi:hypothetical protein